MGSTILDHAIVGEGAIVAAGSLVLSNTVIEPGSIWGGVPAKFIKKVDPEQAKELNQKIAHNYLCIRNGIKNDFLVKSETKLHSFLHLKHKSKKEFFLYYPNQSSLTSKVHIHLI